MLPSEPGMPLYDLWSQLLLTCCRFECRVISCSHYMLMAFLFHWVRTFLLGREMHLYCKENLVMKRGLWGSSVVIGGGSPMGFLILFVCCCRNLSETKVKAARNKEREWGERSWKRHNHLGWQGQVICAPFLLFVLWSNQLNLGKGKENIPATNTQSVNSSIFPHPAGNAIWTDRDISRCQGACCHCKALVFSLSVLGERRINGNMLWRRKLPVSAYNFLYKESEDTEVSVQVMVELILVLFQPCKAEF